MKRHRFVLRDVPIQQHQSILENPGRIIRFLADLDITPPAGVTYLMVAVKTTAAKLDVRYYHSQEDYLIDYTNCVLKDRDDYEFFNFHLFEDVGPDWEPFLPPPVVGLGVRTRLRPGSDF